jgi:ankyrin repeat/SOCS box protein 13/metal transporter CNNM
MSILSPLVIVLIYLFSFSSLSTCAALEGDGGDGDTIPCVQVNSNQVQCNGDLFTLGDHMDVVGSTRFWVDIGVVCGLVLLAGLMSGLTMGLMSLDILNLNIIKNSGAEKDKKCAAKILPLVEKHHLLLVTLLLTNAAAAEALPVFLDRLVHPIVAVGVSVSLVLLFGEIIPQAICTRYGLRVGAYMSWFVWILIAVLFIVAWPIAKLLDFLLGSDHTTFFRRAELKELVNLHHTTNNGNSHTCVESLSYDEVRIIKGAIDMKGKSVAECFTKVTDIFALSIDDILDKTMLQKIVNAGHDRIPIYHTAKEHLIGMILTKDMVLLNPDASTPVKSLQLYQVPMVPSNMPLYDILHQFQTGRSHMAVVLDPRDHISVQGIITLEDVLEELLQDEILDEDDIRRSNNAVVVHSAHNSLHNFTNINANSGNQYVISTSPAMLPSNEQLREVTSLDVKWRKRFLENTHNHAFLNLPPTNLRSVKMRNYHGT